LQAGKAVKVKMVLPVRFAFHAGMASALDTTGTAPEAAADTVVELADAEMPPTKTPAFETEAADRYLFTSTQLGWFNCDRVWHAATNSSADLMATTDADPNTSVYLLFREAKALVAGQAEESGYAFRGVPANKRAVLIGIRYENGTPYLALRETTTGRHATEPLTFRETTLEELERVLERLK
jgi:hypothetical protein